MSEISVTRKANLAKLIGSEKIAVFARRHDLSAEFIRQVMRYKSTRQIGDGTARKIEIALGLASGSLDEPDAGLMDDSFVRKVAREVAARDISAHMQQTILFMLRTAPEKPRTD